ncbi:MAG: ribosomal protein S18-alanine N-acetyltransferase, partial [Oscillospiraceae bacterium]
MAELEISIREITLSECDDFYAIEKICFTDFWSRADFEYQIKSPNSKIIGAFAKNKPVGFVNVQYIAGELSINNIAVLDEHRKKGIAKRLLEYVFQEYPKAECAYLEVRESNTPARRLYEKFDFKAVGKRENYYH